MHGLHSLQRIIQHQTLTDMIASFPGYGIDAPHMQLTSKGVVDLPSSSAWASGPSFIWRVGSLHMLLQVLQKCRSTEHAHVQGWHTWLYWCAISPDLCRLLFPFICALLCYVLQLCTSLAFPASYLLQGQQIAACSSVPKAFPAVQLARS